MTKAPLGGKNGPTPTDQAKKVTKLHVLIDTKGTPLSAQVIAARGYDVTPACILSGCGAAGGEQALITDRLT